MQGSESERVRSDITAGAIIQVSESERVRSERVTMTDAEGVCFQLPHMAVAFDELLS